MPQTREHERGEEHCIQKRFKLQFNIHNLYIAHLNITLLNKVIENKRERERERGREGGRERGRERGNENIMYLKHTI